MADKLNSALGSAGGNGTLKEITSNGVFSELTPEIQGQVISAIVEEEKDAKNTGFMGRIFGNYTENISRYIAFIVSMALILVGLIYIALPICYKINTNVEFWQIIAPIITGALGYVFGSGTSK